MVEFDMEVFQSGVHWSDGALVMAGWFGIFAGMFLYARLMRRPALLALAALCYLVPALNTHIEKQKSRRFAKAVSTGEITVSFGHYERTTGLEHWERLDFGERTTTRFTMRPNEPDSICGVFVESFDDPPKGDSP